MKVFALAAIALATANAVVMKDNTQPAPPKKADPLADFDDKHYANNKVDSLFPDHKPIPESATVSPHDFPTIHAQKKN